MKKKKSQINQEQKAEDASDMGCDTVSHGQVNRERGGEGKVLKHKRSLGKAAEGLMSNVPPPVMTRRAVHCKYGTHILHKMHI